MIILAKLAKSLDFQGLTNLHARHTELIGGIHVVASNGGQNHLSQATYFGKPVDFIANAP
jgi:hypothetical protein